MTPIRVVLVDDEEAVVDVLRTLIGSDPALECVGAAHDAERGILLADEHSPDVVLVDVRMPAGGGVRAVREIRKRHPEARVIALSAHEDEDTKIRMIGAGAHDYVAKTDSTDAILDAIHRAGGKRRRRRTSIGSLTERRSEQRARLERALRSGSVATTFRAIVEAETGRPIGVEARPHVTLLPQRPFDAWLGDAEAVDLVEKLEFEVVRAALAGLRTLPEDVFVEIPVSPRTVMDAGLRRRIRAAVAPRVVLTLSEMAGPGRELAEAVRPLRGSGVRIALADVGADLGGLGRLVEVWPEFARIDRALTDRVDHDPTRHAVVAAVVGWAEKGGAAVIADGVRSPAQLDELTGLGVGLVQGDLVGEERHLADLRSAGPRALDALVRGAGPARGGASTTTHPPAALVAEGAR